MLAHKYVVWCAHLQSTSYIQCTKIEKKPQKLMILLDIGSKKAVVVRVFLAPIAMMLSNISLVHFVIKFRPFFQ